uniref:B cell linker n=1 Tax=Molossus molossus TaxID=27622 RepID=A0A7J8DMS4_MOLMO|nr:B cell linker [Molossus molossus]
MDKLNKITVPASQKLRQFQRMVHDIKNNEGGIMNKIKKLKVKAPPSVPRRDYASATTWTLHQSVRPSTEASKSP